MKPPMTGDVRPSPIAGTWYPGNSERLAKSIDQMLADAPSITPDGQIVGMVVPHAGHSYSGAIAACAFRLVQGMSFERVVIVAPMHHYYDAPILTSSHDAYQTPLGVVPVDRGLLDALWQRIPIASVRRDPEHALEIELPFLQRALSGSFSLVPLMLRDQTYSLAERLGRALAEVLGAAPGTLLVASSDLSHFYTEQEAKDLDETMLSQISAFDPRGVIRAEDEGRGFACGRAAIATVLIASRELGADRVQVVGYGTSADTTGDRDRVVGYGAAVIYQARAETAQA